MREILSLPGWFSSVFSLEAPTTEAIRANCSGSGWLPFKIETISKSVEELAFLSAPLQTAETIYDNAENYPDYPWHP